MEFLLATHGPICTDRSQHPFHDFQNVRRILKSCPLKLISVKEEQPASREDGRRFFPREKLVKPPDLWITP